MANQLTGAVNPSLFGEGDGGKPNAAAAAMAKRQKLGKTELPKVSDNFGGSRGRSEAAKGEGPGLRSGLAGGRGAAACSPGKAIIPDDTGGTPRTKLAASFGKASGTSAKKTAGADGRKGSKTAADKAGGTLGGKRPPHSTCANSTGTPKEVRADEAEESKEEDALPDPELVPEEDEGKDDNLFHLGDLLNDMQALQARMDKEGTTAAQFAAKARGAKDWVDNYKAFVALTRKEGVRALEAALAPEAAHRTYLAIINKEGKFGVFHGL